MTNVHNSRLPVHMSVSSLTTSAEDIPPTPLAPNTHKSVAKGSSATQPVSANMVPVETVTDRITPQPISEVTVPAESITDKPITYPVPIQLLPPKQQDLAYAMEKYLYETPKGGGTTYGLIHGGTDRDTNILNALALFDSIAEEGT